jgi:hypothetical protein
MAWLIYSDIDECMLHTQHTKYEELYPCKNGVCHNIPGSYLCKCKRGTRSDGTNFGCQKFHAPAELVIGKHHACIVHLTNPQ